MLNERQIDPVFNKSLVFPYQPSNEYQIDPVFNKDLLFAYQPPPDIHFSKLPDLAENWFANLQKIIFQMNHQLPKNILDKHVGATSDYRAKIPLLKQLKIIYHRLQGNLNLELGELSADSREALISKLTEEIIHCTEGFHNRVNIIVDSFYIPRNLAELLYSVRKKMVEEVASVLTDEIHSWNHVSFVAASDGLGIKANFPDDIYTGSLSETEIRKALQKKFLKQFTPFHLPCLLVEAFMEFIPELEIEKHCETGLCLETRKKIIRLIKRYLPDHIGNRSNDWQKFFRIFRDKNNPLDISILNVNWDNLYRSFYKALSQKNYFEKEPQINNLIDAAYCNRFSINTRSIFNENLYISNIFVEKRHHYLLQQFTELNDRFPSYYLKIKENKNLITHFIELVKHLDQQLKIMREYSPEIMQGFKLLATVDLRRKNIYIEKASELLILKNPAGLNPLMLAALNDADILKEFLTFFKTHQSIIGKEMIQKMFLEKNKDYSNLLMIAASYHPDSVKYLLEFIEQHIQYFDSLFLKKIFLEKNKVNFNALMVAAMSHSNTVTHILKFIEQHIQYFDNSFLQAMFLEKQNNNYNVLMLAASRQAEAIMTILSFLTNHIPRFANETLCKLFTQKQDTSLTAVSLTAYNYPERVKNILSFITHHIKNFDAEAVRGLLFMEKSENACTALAASNRAEATESILEFIAENIGSFDPVVLQKMFLEKKSNGLTALMLATRDQPRSLKAILKFIGNHPHIFTSLILEQMFLEKDPYGHHSLMLAAKCHPDAVAALLHFITEQEGGIFNSSFLNLFLLTHDKFGVNALMLAATYQIRSIELLLTFLTENINYISIDDIQEFVFKRIHDKEAAMAVFFGGRYNVKKSVLSVTAQLEDPTAINALLKFIDDHIELLGIKVFADLLTEKDSKDTYIFRHACSRYPAMKNTLNYIANSANNEDLIFIQGLVAYFILEQLARWPIETDESFLDKIILNYSALLLTYFSKDYFSKQPTNNLKLVTDKLFTCYLNELEDRKAQNITYTTKFSFFRYRYSTNQKLEASIALEKGLHVQNKEQAFIKLKDQYPALSDGRLSKLFEAYQEINKLGADDACNTDIYTPPHPKYA